MRFVRQLRSPMMLTGLFSAVVTCQAAAADPPARIGRVSYLSGAVSFRADATADWVGATLNYPITSGYELWSSGDARAEVHVGSSAVRLAPQTMVDFVDVSDHRTEIRLTQGSLYVRLRELQSGDTYEINTPDGAVDLLDAGRYRIDVAPSGDRATVTVRDGDADVFTRGGGAVSVLLGESVAFTGPDSPGTRVSLVAVDDWEGWCADRDEDQDASLSLRYISPGYVGYEALDGYGTWQVDPTFGPVWFPTVSAGWAPYRFGYWTWVDPWGWTWVDDEPWGFAPFHYGRWAFLRTG